MSILVDTCAVIAVRNADDINHKKAMEIMVPVLRGQFGKVFVSDYIFDEAVTLAYIRTKNKKFVHDIAKFIRSKPINLRFIEPSDFENAWELYRKFDDKHFSFTDCTNIAIMERLRIDTLFTFDSEFNGIVNVRPF